MSNRKHWEQLRRSRYPDFCRTIRTFDHARRGKNAITPSKKLLEFGSKIVGHVRIYFHDFIYRPTKGWLLSRRTD